MRKCSQHTRINVNKVEITNRLLRKLQLSRMHLHTYPSLNTTLRLDQQSWPCCHPKVLLCKRKASLLKWRRRSGTSRTILNGVGIWRLQCNLLQWRELRTGWHRPWLCRRLLTRKMQRIRAKWNGRLLHWRSSDTFAIRRRRVSMRSCIVLNAIRLKRGYLNKWSKNTISSPVFLFFLLIGALVCSCGACDDN